MRAASRFGHLLLFLAACAVGVFAMRNATPAPTEMGLAAKLSHYGRHAEEIDAVYLGSSRVFRSFLPTEIDAELARRGHTLRTFNLGLPGMGDFEAGWMLGEVLEAGEGRLRWVVLEPPKFDPVMYAANTRSARELNWHTTPVTRDAVAAVLERPESTERRELLLAHLELWGRRLLNLGQGRRLLASWFDGDADVARHGLTDAVLAEGGGYRALEDEAAPEFAQRRERFLADTQGFLRQVAGLEPRRRMRPSLEGYPLDVLADQIARIRAAGAEPVYVMPPGGQARAIAFSLLEAGHIPTLVDLSSPAELPAFFTVESRFDKNHLTHAAAVAFSRLFAARFADVIEGTP